MSTLQELERRYPEWRPLVADVRALVAELGNAAWDAAVPALSDEEADASTPLAARAGLRSADVPLALLHACRRRWSEAVPAAWRRGYCPVCGAWPAFAEVSGVERSRFLRCLRCGCAWRAQGLACAFCANADHGRLGVLVEDAKATAAGSAWSVEVCHACRAYLKTFTVLRPSDGHELVLRDLASIELDLAAEQRGYRRPMGDGYAGAS